METTTAGRRVWTHVGPPLYRPPPLYWYPSARGPEAAETVAIGVRTRPVVARTRPVAARGQSAVRARVTATLPVAPSGAVAAAVVSIGGALLGAAGGVWALLMVKFASPGSPSSNTGSYVQLVAAMSVISAVAFAGAILVLNGRRAGAIVIGGACAGWLLLAALLAAGRGPGGVGLALVISVVPLVCCGLLATSETRWWLQVQVA